MGQDSMHFNSVVSSLNHRCCTIKLDVPLADALTGSAAAQ